MTTKTIAQTVSAESEAQARASVLVPALSALLLGVFLVFGAGFAGSSTLHNAAHDSRHAFAFPCH
jgi:cobalt transporter subunit CbtB